MERKLGRSILERAGAILWILLVVLVFWLEFEDLGLLGKSALVIFSVIVLINFIFIAVTPAAKVVGGELHLYAGAQPIFLNLRPQVVPINQVTDFKISKGLIGYRAIFSLQYGSKVYYGFPASSDRQVSLFLEFLENSTESAVFASAYESLLKQET